MQVCLAFHHRVTIVLWDVSFDSDSSKIFQMKERKTQRELRTCPSHTACKWQAQALNPGCVSRCRLTLVPGSPPESSDQPEGKAS